MSLTQPQFDMHWNNRSGWGLVCRVNQWRGGDVSVAAGAAKADRSQWHQKVWAFAHLMARSEHREAVVVDDLRKGCYLLALGEPKSLTEFDNSNLDRVLIVFRLMVEPDDLRAVSAFIAYEKYDLAKREIFRCKRLGIPCAIELPDDPGERRRHLYQINQNPQALILHLCRDRFAGQLPDDMPLSELRQLTMILRNRRNYKNRPVYDRKPAYKRQAAEQPF